MGAELVWSEDRRLVELRLRGELDGATIADAHAEIFLGPHAAGLRWKLCDMTAAELGDVSPGEIHTLVRLDAAWVDQAPGLESILIAGREDLAYGYARMYQVLMEDRVRQWDVHVERTRDELFEYVPFDPEHVERPE